MRLKRKWRYVILKVSDDKSEVLHEASGPRDQTFAEFKEAVPKQNAR